MAVMTETNVEEASTEEEERIDHQETEAAPESERSEVPISTPEEDLSVQIDLNRADEEELQQLPGVGPKLASDIIAYREANGPFLKPEDVTDVPGIGSGGYDEWAERLTATLPESELGKDVPPPPIPEVEGETIIGEEESTRLKSDIEEPLTSPVEEPPQPEIPEDELSEVEEEQPEKEPLPAGEEEKEEKRGKTSPNWLWTALRGGVLGLIFSLIVMAGINQTLDYASSRDMDVLRRDLTNLSSDLDTLESDLQDAQNQINELADLTTRMEQAEADLTTLRSTSERLTEQTQVMSEDLESVQTEVNGLTNDMDEVKSQTETTMNFFEELGRLLQEMLGNLEPEAKLIIPSVPSLAQSQGGV